MITSTGNTKIKELVKLKKKPAERERRGVFIAEGRRLFEEIPQELIESVYISESYAKKYGSGAGDEVLSDDVFEYVSDTRTPQGILAVVRMPKRVLCDVVSDPQGLYLVIESVQDPGNMGTMIRTAAAAGCTGVILLGDCADLYNPKTVRSTMGSIFKIPVARAESVGELAAVLNEKGITTFAASLENAACYNEMPMRDGAAVMIGNEGSGLGGEALSIADKKIYIPMRAGVESLNAAMAAAVILFEAARQRA